MIPISTDIANSNLNFVNRDGSVDTMLCWYIISSNVCSRNSSTKCVVERLNRYYWWKQLNYDDIHRKAPMFLWAEAGPYLSFKHFMWSTQNRAIAPTDKELEMLFQPMFDEHLEQSPVDEQVPSATEVNAQVAPPGSAQSSSGNDKAVEPNHDNYPPDHIRRWTKDHPLDNIVGNPSRPVSTRKQLASDALWCCFHTERQSRTQRTSKMARVEDCWFQAMQNEEIHEFDQT
ncbi:hypothetical protein Tco_0822972 [Tanacetum coccineum]|uniref:Uncharacterized protein n=1 Tax=Tanacetum coccineum TaxID=301880 RepID=A0ABQ5AKX7_9ASTR